VAVTQWILKSKGGMKGKKCFQPSNPQRVNIYMAINSKGATKVHKVAGSKGYKSTHKNLKGEPARNITWSEYGSVLRDTLLPCGSKGFANQGMSSFIFQQDNDPTHKKPAARELAAWNASHPGRLVTLLPNWPPNSPDLNPIEKVWGIVQREVDAAGCSSFDEFEAMVIEKCQNFPQATLRNLVKSMGKRMRMVVAAEGDKIRY
jgi:hypothetical protein